MRPDQLKAIVERQEQVAKMALDETATLLHWDAVALLDLLRKVEYYTDAEEGECDGHYCPMCRAEVFGPPEARLSLAQDHAADCPAPVLQALKK